MDGSKYIGRGKSKKLARIEAAANALRDFIQFKDQALIKNGVIGINTHLLTSLSEATNSNNSNTNFVDKTVDFTSDDHIDNTGILLNHNNLDHTNMSVNSNTVDEDNLLGKIQQTLDSFATKNQKTHAWISRLQSKYSSNIYCLIV